MILCIIVLAAAVRLAWIHDPQFHREFLEEICSGLLTTILCTVDNNSVHMLIQSSLSIIP